jgi:hypothetical protein
VHSDALMVPFITRQAERSGGFFCGDQQDVDHPEGLDAFCMLSPTAAFYCGAMI